MIIGRLIFEDPKMLGATLLDSVLFERKKQTRLLRKMGGLPVRQPMDLSYGETSTNLDGALQGNFEVPKSSRVMGWSCCNPLMHMEESPFPCVTEQHCPFWPRQFRCQVCERFFFVCGYLGRKKRTWRAWCTCRICEANTVVGEYSLPMIGNTFPNGGFLIAILVYQKVTKNYPSPQPRSRHSHV